MKFSIKTKKKLNEEPKKVELITPQEFGWARERAATQREMPTDALVAGTRHLANGYGNTKLSWVIEPNADSYNFFRLAFI